MARSRRAKSQSVSSASGIVEASAVPNGIMPPPSPPATTTSTPRTRHRKTPSVSTSTSPRERDTPLTIPKRIVDAAAGPVGTPSIPPQKPGVARFVLVAGLSALVEALLQSVASQLGTGDLAAVSKHSESWPEIASLLAWKATTLGVYWFGGFDGKHGALSFPLSSICLEQKLTPSLSSIRRGCPHTSPQNAEHSSSFVLLSDQSTHHLSHHDVLPGICNRPVLPVPSHLTHPHPSSSSTCSQNIATESVYHHRSLYHHIDYHIVCCNLHRHFGTIIPNFPPGPSRDHIYRAAVS